MTSWQVLGVSPDIGVADLRRRYAALIKAFRPETHPQDFARIREAYEVALPHARRREAEIEDAAPVVIAQAVPGLDEVAVANAQQDVPDAEADAPVALEIVTPVTVAAPAAEADDEPVADDESGLAAHFRRFQALAGAATSADDEARLPELRALLQARAQATLDDSQALEFALMRWFIESETPPLTLLFETGRAFDWHAHVTRLSSWLSPWALRQMEARLALSRDLVHARHFSGNAWLRRLHSANARRPVLVFRPAALEALHWAERWRALAEDADATSLQADLDARTLKGLHGFASTDVLLGLGVAATAWDLASALVMGLAATALVFLLRLVLQAIVRLPPEHRLRRWLRPMMNHVVVSGLACAVAGIAGALLIEAPAPGEAPVALATATVVGFLLIIPVTLLGAALLWRVAAFLELVLALPWQWREAVDRLEFDRMLQGRAASDAQKPFGSRLGLFQRLKSIRPALKLQVREIATRARPPRAKPFKLIRLTSVNGKTNPWRALWFIAWIAFAILRLLNAFGTH